MTEVCAHQGEVRLRWTAPPTPSPLSVCYPRLEGSCLCRVDGCRNGAYPDAARSRQVVLPSLTLTGEKLVPGAREVLTEIFKSCAHSEQMLSLTPAKPIKVSDIYLSKEQINSQTPGNLLHLFFTNVRPPKKVLEDQLTQVAVPPCRT